MNTAKPTSTVDSPPAALRKLLTLHFSDAELQTLAHDIGADYEELAGDTKTAKAIQLIQYAARHGKIVDLVEACRRERPDVDWNAVGVAAATNPQQFAFVPDDKPLINASPDRALKLGAILGAVMVLLLGCGFGGGLLAGQVVSVTINPVQPDPSSLGEIQIRIADQTFTPQGANATFGGVIEAIATGQFPPNTPVTLWLDEVQATTIADELVKANPDAPISDPHVRFLDNGDISLNFRLKALGNRRVALAYTAEAQNGRVVLTPTSVALNLIEAPGSSFGWVPVPPAMADEATRWLQTQLDNASNVFWFTHVEVTPTEQGNQLIVSGTTR
jgi:hypothetical protein